jgi:predicted HicB family RNase H-like nuclease
VPPRHLDGTTMHPDSQQQPARFNVRLDDELRSRIEAAAQASRRSMNAEICHRIEQAFIEQRPDAATA